MSKLKVYYSVQNGGDGSAYPVFFTDKDVAEFHQEQENEDGEGWAESCTGDITFEGDNLCCPEATTKEGYYLELLLDGWENEDEVQKFVSKFFPKGIPKFDVNILNERRFGVLVEGKVIYEAFCHPGNTSEKKRLILLKKLTN